ncbi:hypothetical protein [Arundinibacter roseus]|nr:hypothetical protein [Arundinibacter roseus]
MQVLHKKGIGIYTLSDLLNQKLYPKIGNLLIQCFNEILFDEPTIDTTNLSKKDSDLLINGRNHKFWRPFSESNFETKQKYDTARKMRYRQEKRFRQMIDSSPTAERLHKLAAELIATKWEILSNPIVPLLHYTLNVEMGQSIIPTAKECPITGIDISDQKGSSRYLSERTLKSDPELLKSLPVTIGQQRRRKHHHPEEYYVAHNIRNAASNPRNSIKRRIERAVKNTPLFQADEVIRLTDEQKKILQSVPSNVPRNKKPR